MTHRTATATADGFTKIARTADLMHAKDIPANWVIDDDGRVTPPRRSTQERKPRNDWAKESINAPVVVLLPRANVSISAMRPPCYSLLEE